MGTDTTIFLTTILLTAIMILIPIMMLNAFWFVHIQMVEKHCKEYHKGNRKIFFENFEKYNLQLGYMFKDSFFGTEEDISKASFYHASIIQFNGVGMKLIILDWYIAQIKLSKLKKKIREERKAQKSF